MKKEIFLRLKAGKQKALLNKAIKKAGSGIKLSKILTISISMVYAYRNEIHSLNIDVGKKLGRFLELNFEQIKYSGFGLV